MSHVVIRRCGTMIDISPDGQSPLHPGIVDLLRPKLSYEHRTLLQGHARFGPDGRKRSVDVEIRRMFSLEEGRLVTGFGFIFAINQILRQNGITAHYIDLSPPKPEGTYEPDWENVNRYMDELTRIHGKEYKFRPRQEECLRQIASHECGLVNAAMGFGKTDLIGSLCHLYPRAKFAIVVRPKDVAARIVSKLSKTLPNVGQIGGGRKFRGDRVTIYTAGSVHHAENSDEDFLLADEVHLLMSDVTARGIAASWQRTRNFGFTATPKGRLDNADAQLELFFGPQIFHLPYNEAVELGLVVPVHVRWLPIRLTHNPGEGKDGVTKQRWAIWRNTDRNQLIAEDVRRNYPDQNNQQVLLLTDKVEHAIMLWQHLPEFSLCYGGEIEEEKLEYYKRNRLLPENFRPVTAAVREQMRLDFESGKLKRVIATDVWATGVDFASLSVLYRCDSRESEILDSQAPGRVSRISPETGKQYGEVVDCFDAFDSGLKRKSQSRKAHYAALGWSQDWPSGRSQIDRD